jgi:MFS family permease
MPARTIATVSIVAGTFMSVLGSTMLNVPIGSIARDLHVTIAAATLLITAQSVTFATLLPIGDWVGNRFGRRNVYCTVLAGYSVSCFAGMLAPSLGVLVAVRVVQGICAAGIVPLVMTLLAELYAPRERPLALSAWAMANSAGQACGPPLGGLLAMAFSWRSIFLPPGVIGALACVATLRYLPVDRPRVSALEWRGAIALASGTALLLTAFVAIPQLGLFSPLVGSFTLTGCACIALFAWRIRTAPVPFVSPRAFADPSYRTPCIGVFASTVVFGAALLAIPLYLTQVLAMPLAAAGFITLTMPLAMSVVAPFSSVVIRRVGTGRTQQLGLTAFALAAGSLTFAVARHLGALMLIPGMVVLGAALAAMYTAGAVGTTQTEAGRFGAGVGFFNLVRVGGSAIGAAYVALVLAGDAGGYALIFAIGCALALIALAATVVSQSRQVIAKPT